MEEMKNEKDLQRTKNRETTELIKMCSALGGYIVCANEIRAKQTAEMAHDMGFNIPYPITFDDFISGNYHTKGVEKFYIDNADQLLQKLAGGVFVEAIVMDDTTKWDEM